MSISVVTYSPIDFSSYGSDDLLKVTMFGNLSFLLFMLALHGFIRVKVGDDLMPELLIFRLKQG
jgi:hypothetical protein